MKKLKEKYFNFLDEQAIKYFKPSDDSNQIIIPYKVFKTENKLNVFCEIYDELDLIKFGFIQNKNPQVNSYELKSGLLDMNSKIMFGTLSLEENSNIIKYSIDFIVDEETDLTLKNYRNKILMCLDVYTKLLEKEYISTYETVC